jgi:hypothetical protein
MHDWGHFEWTPTGRQLVETAKKAQESASLHGAALRAHFGHRGHPFGHGKEEWEAPNQIDPTSGLPRGKNFRDTVGVLQNFPASDLPALKSLLRPREQRVDLSPGDLLKSAQRVGMAGTMQHTVTGRAGVDINLTGFPRGTTARTSAAGIFSEVKLDRGRVPRADTEA